MQHRRDRNGATLKLTATTDGEDEMQPSLPHLSRSPVSRVAEMDGPKGGKLTTMSIKPQGGGGSWL